MTEKKKEFEQTKKSCDFGKCVEIKEQEEIRKLMNIVITENIKALKELAK